VTEFLSTSSDTETTMHMIPTQLIPRSIRLALVIAALTSVDPLQAEEFSYRNLTSARMKLDKHFDFEANADSYMQAFRYDIYKAYRNDEFQFRRKLSETVGMMKEAAEQFSLDAEMTLNVRLTLGNYNFAKQDFPIIEMNGSNYWYKNCPYHRGNLPSSYSVHLTNKTLIRSIPMSERNAEAFIAARKTSYGSVNRSIEGVIRFKILKLRGEKNEFDVEVQSARFFADEARTRVLHSVVKKDESKAKKSEVVFAQD
jgi:hypothetical protein